MAKCFIVSSVLGMVLNICNPQEAEVESFGGNLGCIVQLLMNKGNHLGISFVGCLFGKFESLRLIPSMENGYGGMQRRQEYLKFKIVLAI